MSDGADTLRDGVTWFRGELSRHLLFRPMVSNAYLLEDEDDVILFDPSCGKRIATRIEDHVRGRRQAGSQWTRAYVVAGHSHMDHAGNLGLIRVFGVAESHVYIHERGFVNGQVMNEPRSFIERQLSASRDHYNIYLALPLPYRVLMLPLVAVDLISRRYAVKAFAAMAAVPWPRPRSGSAQPEPLQEEALQSTEIGGMKLKAWHLGNTLILPTPGHSPCSVSLLWPLKRTLLVSDADWLGNPVFLSSSLRESIHSLRTLYHLTEAAGVDLLCSAHGEPLRGTEKIKRYLDLQIHRLAAIRDEILDAYEARGRDPDVRKLASLLATRYPLFKSVRLLDYPKLVVMAHNVVAVCLREEEGPTGTGA